MLGASMALQEDGSRLLRLPIELRRLIYSHVLPRTTVLDVHHQRSVVPPPKPAYYLTFVREKNGDGGWRMLQSSPRTERETGNDIVWLRGSTQLLGVNRQVHEEAADMLYKDNVFVVDVAFTDIMLRYRWQTADGLIARKDQMFLTHFSQRNLLRIRQYVINVESADDYTGMITYNCSIKTRPAGLRVKLQELADLLIAASPLRRLELHLIDGAINRIKFPSGRVHRVHDEANFEQTQQVLEPFGLLHGVPKVKVSGVGEEYAAKLSQSLSMTTANQQGANCASLAGSAPQDATQRDQQRTTA